MSDDPTKKRSLLSAADATAQGLGALQITKNLVGLAVMTIVLLIAGVYAKLYQRGYTSNEHVIDEVLCEPEGQDCKRATSADTCSKTVKCTVSGSGFGPLQRVYPERQQPQVGQLVRVHTSPTGDATLESGVSPWLGTGLLIGSAGSAVMWLVTYKLRHNTWFRRLNGITD